MMIDGVMITPLRQILDERGKVMHMLRCDSVNYQQFGEIYFSCVYPNAVKAWKKHDKMTLNYAVPVGRVKIVLYDERSGSPTEGEIQEIYTGEDSYCLITIPPEIWTGFKGIGIGMAMIANCATIPHDSFEVLRLDFDSTKIPYNWNSIKA